MPVNYSQEGEYLWVISSRERVWWRNLKGNSQLHVWIGGKRSLAEAELVLDLPLIAGRLTAMCTGNGFTARAFGIRLVEGGQPLETDVQKSASQRLFVRICLMV